MNDRTSVEDRLEALGAALRARPPLTGRVMIQVRKAAAQDLALAPAGTRVQPRRRLLTRAAYAALAISAAALFAMMLPSSPAVGWAEVAKVLQSQKWIRGRVTYADGKQGTLWISPERQIWAFKLDPSISFFAGREHAKYEYRGGNQAITKLPLGEDDAQKVLPLDALSQDKDTIGPWLMGAETILHQERREVKEDGRAWIEFQLTLSRGEMNQATLRVDPKTKLPVYLLFSSPKDKTKFSKFEFDYPTDGPSDIYAVGVPRDIKIDDRMPSAGTAELIKAMAASRASIGEFRLIVGHPSNMVGATAIYPGSVVSRSGNRWRIDRCFPPDVPGAPEPPEGAGWDEWARDQVKRTKLIPLFICDGKTIWENSGYPAAEKPRWEVSKNTSPQDLMSGAGLGNLSMAPHVKFAALLFPDLSPKQGWSFEVDPMPAEAPGCILVKRSAAMSSPEPLVGHEWYYVDPAKGHAVVRMELFAVAPWMPSDPKASKYLQTIEMEGFQKSPAGWWYCSVVHDTMPAVPGNDLPYRTSVRYSFDFTADLPLFSIEPEKAP